MEFGASKEPHFSELLTALTNPPCTGIDEWQVKNDRQGTGTWYHCMKCELIIFYGLLKRV